MQHESSDLPDPSSLVEGTQLYDFVINPNVKSDGSGNYVINYSDPNYIEGDPLTINREERRDPELDDIIVCVNFSQKTATVTVGDHTLDISTKFFLNTRFE